MRIQFCPRTHLRNFYFFPVGSIHQIQHTLLAFLIPHRSSIAGLTDRLLFVQRHHRSIWLNVLPTPHGDSVDRVIPEHLLILTAQTPSLLAVMPQNRTSLKEPNAGCHPFTTKITKATATMTQNLNGMGKTFSLGNSSFISLSILIYSCRGLHQQTTDIRAVRSQGIP